MEQNIQLEKRIDAVLEGKETQPQDAEMDLKASREALEAATTAELEQLLTSPEIGTPQNEGIRDQILGLLTERLGADYVGELLAAMRPVGGAWLQFVTSREEEDAERTPADRARDKLRELHCPLAEIVPDHVMNFVIDPNGTFYMRLEQTEMVHLKDFDILLEEEISGIVEEDWAHHLHGVKGLAQMQDSMIEFEVRELRVDRTRVTITTDHPVARVVQVHMDQFLFAIMTTM